jgi:hypothetical protein
MTSKLSEIIEVYTEMSRGDWYMCVVFVVLSTRVMCAAIFRAIMPRKVKKLSP